MDCLLLNADGKPKQVISWMKAIEYLLRDVVVVLDSYEDWKIRSPSTEFVVPAVLVLKRYVNINKRVQFNRTNVYIRDDFTCQYCGDGVRNSSLSVRDLTFDHVIPRSKGGTTQWTNIVTACEPCNRLKEDKFIHETNLSLLQQPREPRILNDVEFRLRQKRDLPEQWKPFLSWMKAKAS